MSRDREPGTTLEEQINLARSYAVQVQIALAYQVAHILRNELNFDMLDTKDLLDALAIAGLHLTDGGTLTSEAYMRVIA